MKRKYLTFEDAHQILDPFKLMLGDVPEEVPYLTKTGLELPERLTSKEIRQIAVAARLWDRGGFALGDLLLWLRDHPDAAIPYQTFVNMLQRIGLTRRTIYNYQSVSNSFSLADRQVGLSRPHHDAVRGLPRREQRKLLREAAARGLSYIELQREANIRKDELAMPAPDGGSGANRSLIMRSQAALALERFQARSARIQHILAKPKLTAKESAALAREVVALFDEIENAKDLITHR